MIADLLGNAGILHPCGHRLLERYAQSLEYLIVYVMFLWLLEPFASHPVEREIQHFLSFLNALLHAPVLSVLDDVAPSQCAYITETQSAEHTEQEGAF